VINEEFLPYIILCKKCCNLYSKITYGYFKDNFNFWHKFTNIFCFSFFRILF